MSCGEAGPRGKIVRSNGSEPSGFDWVSSCCVVVRNEVFSVGDGVSVGCEVGGRFREGWIGVAREGNAPKFRAGRFTLEWGDWSCLIC